MILVGAKGAAHRDNAGGFDDTFDFGDTKVGDSDSFDLNNRDYSRFKAMKE